MSPHVAGARHRIASHQHKTQTILSRIALDAKGWVLGSLDPEMIVGPQVYLYLWDQASDWQWMCSVPLDRFVSMTTKVRQVESEWDSMRGSGPVGARCQSTEGPFGHD